MKQQNRADAAVSSATARSRSQGQFEVTEYEWYRFGLRHRLSPRELEVVQRLLRTPHHAEIATELALSPNTVKTYMRRAYDKLGVHSRSDLLLRLFSDIQPRKLFSARQQT